MRYKRSFQYLLQEIEDKLLIVHKDFFWILKSFFFGKIFLDFISFWLLTTSSANTFLFQKIFESIFFWNKKYWLHSHSEGVRNIP